MYMESCGECTAGAFENSLLLFSSHLSQPVYDDSLSKWSLPGRRQADAQ
jgi:hypothetical protein